MKRETVLALAIVVGLFALVMIVGLILGPDQTGIADPNL